MVAKNNGRILLLISLPLVVAIELLFFAWLFTLPQAKPVVGKLDKFALNVKPEVSAVTTSPAAAPSKQPAKQSVPSLPIADDFTQFVTPDFEVLHSKEDSPQTPAASNLAANTLRGGETSWDVRWPSASPPITAPSELTEQSRSNGEPLANGLRGDQESKDEATTRERPLAGMPTRELLQKWCEAESADVFPFEGELTKRGFGRVSKDLAQHYLSNDSQQRQRLVDDVLKRAGIDARPWLLLLADDDDAEVRLASVTVMATSTDPALIEKAWQVAIRDRDPRIAELAGRLRERHSKTLSR